MSWSWSWSWWWWWWSWWLRAEPPEQVSFIDDTVTLAAYGPARQVTFFEHAKPAANLNGSMPPPVATRSSSET